MCWYLSIIQETDYFKVRHPVALFKIMNGTFHRQYHFIIGINLSYCYGRHLLLDWQLQSFLFMLMDDAFNRQQNFINIT